MLAAFCFAKSSKKLHNWFTNTKLYKDNLADYVAGKGMTIAAKRRVMLTVTALMAFGFMMMLRKALYIPCAVLGCVWVFHLLYFAFGMGEVPEGRRGPSQSACSADSSPKGRAKGAAARNTSFAALTR